MPRPKTLPDEAVLDAALRLVRRHGPDGLTFAALARACGLSAATLVQRFESKAGLVRSTLLHAWDRLDDRTAKLAAEVPRTAEGAIRLLTGLSTGYGDIDAYAEGLLVLRADPRDPVLRARGAAWKAALCQTLDDCMARLPHAPRDIGLLMASQWQGSLLWWSFDPRADVARSVEDGLRCFVDAVSRSRVAKRPLVGRGGRPGGAPARRRAGS